MAAADQPQAAPDLAAEIRTDLGPVEYLVVGHVTVDVFEKRYILGGSPTSSR